MKRYNNIIILIVLQLFLFSGYVLSQDIHTALQDYEKGQLNNVRAALLALQNIDYDKPEYLFLKAVFEQNAENAFEQYENLGMVIAQNPLYERVLWKMCQYYYAKELYETCAESIERFMNVFPQSEYTSAALKIKAQIYNHLNREENIPFNPPVQQTVVTFTLQLGVFGTESNARRQLDYFQKLGLQKAYIKEQYVGSQIVYKIWFGEYINKQAAQTVRDELMQRYKISDIFITEKK